MALMPSRAERVMEASQLRGEGLIYREIAERMGLSITYVQGLVRDPEGHKDRERKARTRRACVDCGRPCTGTGGQVGGSKRCAECAVRHAKANARWNRESIVAAIKRWADLYGRQPSATNWNAGSRRCDRGRYYGPEGPWPSTGQVQHVFGRWNAAIEVAGFEPLRDMHGRRPGSLTQEAKDRTVALHRAGVPIAQIAAEFGITPNGVTHRLDVIGEPRKRRNHTMAAPLTAAGIIGREATRMKERVERLREEANQLEKEAGNLDVALATLNGAAGNVTGAKAKTPA